MPYPGCEEFYLWKKHSGNNKIEWSKKDFFNCETGILGTQFLTKDELKAEHRRLKNKYASIWRL